MQPWLDHGGRLSPLKLLVFIALFLPGAWTAIGLACGYLGAEPLKEAIHQLGLWTVRWLFITLAITPARQLLDWPRLILVRRMVGVAAFAYGLAHLLLYAADQSFDLAKVASEIVFRVYLTIGIVALLGLAALAATSTDGMIRRLGGRRWRRLHRLIYAIAVLGLLHYFIQAKLELYEPTVMAGFLLWLLGYRLVAAARRDRRVPLGMVAMLGITAAAFTTAGETTYFWLHTGADPLRVLAVNLSLETGVRPGPVVLGVGAAVAAMAASRLLLKRRGAPGWRLG